MCKMYLSFSIDWLNQSAMHLVIASRNVLNWFLPKKSKTAKVVGLMVLSSKRRIWHDTEI